MYANVEPLNIERTAIEGAVYLPLALLKPSPTNPRKRFDATHLAELAESVRKHGVLQPVLVRPIDGAQNGEALYEIVAGERRWRASQTAEQANIMALVRPMSDFEVLELQVIENLQRDDLHPIEEAEGFAALLRKPEGLQGYATVDELAARIGKSRRHVYNRLKLLELIPQAREACLDGKLQPTVALLLAAMPEDVQPQALKELLAGWGGEPFSRRQACEHLQRNFMLELSRAPFKTADIELVPAAGSCTTCPKRTGANPDLFEDIKNGNTCTDAKCFNLKADTHRERVKTAAREQGMEVISGAAAKKLLPNSYDTAPKGYLALDKVHYEIGDKPMGKLLGKDAPSRVLIENPHTLELIEAVPVDAAMAVLKKKGIVKASKMPTTSAEARKSKAAVDASKAWRTELATRVMGAVVAPGVNGGELAAMMWPEAAIVMWQRLSADDERRCEKLLNWDHIPSGWQDPKGEAKSEERIRALAMPELAQLLVLMCVAGDLYVGEHSEDKKAAPRLARFAKFFGIDVDQVRRDLAAGKTSAPAAKPDATEAFVAAHAKPGARSGSAAGKPAARYRDPMTGSTWSGRGLKPRWLVVALEDGHKLEEFDVLAQGAAGQDAAGSQASDARSLKREKSASTKAKRGSVEADLLGAA